MNSQALITSKLAAKGIITTGIYAPLVQIVEKGVKTVREFGFDYWAARTTAGLAVKEVVKELAIS